MDIGLFCHCFKNYLFIYLRWGGERERQTDKQTYRQIDSGFAHATLSAWKSEDNDSHFSSSIMCVPGMKHRSLSLVASPFIH